MDDCAHSSAESHCKDRAAIGAEKETRGNGQSEVAGWVAAPIDEAAEGLGHQTANHECDEYDDVIPGVEGA